MADEPLLTITLSKRGDEFRADLDAPSEVNGVKDLHLHGVSHSAIEAIEECIAQLESKATDGDKIALRFT